MYKFIINLIFITLCVEILPQKNLLYESYLAHIAAANSSFRLNEGGEGKRWINNSPENFRDWEYYYLKKLSEASQISFKPPEGKPLKAVFSPDDNNLLVAYENGLLALYDASTLLLLREFKGIHSSAVYAIKFSDNGRFFYSVSRDSFLCKVNYIDGSVIWKVHTGGHGLADIDLHDDKIAVSSWYFEKDKGVTGFIGIHSASDGKRIWYSEYGVKPILSVRFSHDGKLLAAGTWGWKVGVWKIDSSGSSYNMHRQFDYDDVSSYSAIDCISFSNDGKFVSSASKSGYTRTWDIEGDSLFQQLENRGRGISCVMYSADDEALYTGGFDGTIMLWHRKKGILLKKLFGHGSRILSMQPAHGFSKFVTTSDDSTIKIWSFSTGREFSDYNFRNRYTWAFALSRDGSILIASDSDSSVALWNAETGQPIKSIKTSPDILNDVSIHPDNKSFAGINWNGDIMLWDTMSGEVIRKFEGIQKGGAKISFSPDGNQLTAVSTEKKLFTWETKTGNIISILTLPAIPNSVCYSPDASLIITGLRDGTLVIVDGKGGSVVDSFKAHNSAIHELDVSEDNKYLLTCSEDKLIKKWDLKRKSLLAVMAGHEARVFTARFIQGSNRIISGSADNTIKFWNSQNGDLVLTNSDPGDPVYNIRLYPDKRRILVNSSGREFILLDGRP